MKMQEGFCGAVQPLPTSVKAPLRRGPLRFARQVLDESAEKQQNSVRMR